MPLLTLLPRGSRLQGIEQAVDPCSHPRAGLGTRAADPLLGFTLSRDLPPPETARALNAASPHALSASHAEAALTWRSRVFITERVGLPLARAAVPPEVLVLVVTLAA